MGAAERAGGQQRVTLICTLVTVESYPPSGGRVKGTPDALTQLLQRHGYAIHAFLDLGE